ncbi:MAG: penicillin-binding protein 2 [Rhabdochlamydiaceae bacterium]|nr:penicillin-binding protein 2 [Rhabdochlamydiaceae bacterium]
MQQKSLRDLKRLIVIAVSLFFLFALLILQFYKIQIIDGDKWKRVANKQHRLGVVEPYQRGVFYSNTTLRKGHPENPHPLVMDVPRYHLYADPVVINLMHHDKIIETLKQITGISANESLKLKAQLGKKSRSRKMILWLTPEMRELILKWWIPYAKSHKIPRNALFFIQDYKRSYPFGKLLGQVLHTVRSERDVLSKECTPTGGLEHSFNRFLKGEDGRRVILRSPRQPLDMGQVIKEPKHGADVYLTIDRHLQAIAEEEIKQAVIKAEARSGWAIMMDPYTGEIIAWAQYPFFEPAKYQEYFNDPVKQQATIINGITVPFEPGSTIKSITVAIALKANLEMKRLGKPPLFSLDEKIKTATRNFKGRGKPLKDTHFHKYLNFEMGMQKSSNVYMATLVERVIENLGEKWYLDALEKIFGFGIKTGIELPAEGSGFLPRHGMKYANGRPVWSKGAPFSMAMGHSIMASALQMVRAYGIFANGGLNVKPTLIKKIVSHDGTILFEHLKEPSERLLEKEIVDQTIRAMRFDTKKGGTSSRADIPGYTEAGKTGTTEKVIKGVYSKKDHISTFIGFAPAINPRFVLSIVIDDPAYKYIPGVGKNQMAGICAAPCFSKLGLRALQYLGIPPDDPNNDVWLKEINDLNKLYLQWNH